ncbi:hypothetical protein LSAT2_025461 [Lamellibrachia satsuma]|nr:hypothetical protein LSAT2_025461 [Lamellibrachia satsuma]
MPTPRQRLLTQQYQMYTSDDITSIGRQRSSEGHHVTFCDSLVESTMEGNDSSVIINDALENRNNSSAVKERLDTVRQCDSQPVSPAGDATPKAPILRVHRTPRGCTKMKELEVELEELRLLVVAMVGREQGGCASSSGGGTVDDKVGKDTRDARENSPQPGRKLRGGKVTGRRETGRKETGRKGMGGKTTG